MAECVGVQLLIPAIQLLRMCTGISVLKIFENEEKWLISVNEDPDMINTTLDNRRSLRQLIIGVSFFLAFQAVRKSLKYVKFKLTANQDLFQALSSVKFGESLTSVLHLTDAIVTIPDTGTSMTRILICC